MISRYINSGPLVESTGTAGRGAIHPWPDNIASNISAAPVVWRTRLPAPRGVVYQTGQQAQIKRQ